MSKKNTVKKLNTFPGIVKHTFPYGLFLVTIIFLATFSLWKALFFQFWRDDWGDTWGVLYHTHEFLTTWAAPRLHPGSGLEKYVLAQLFQTNPFPWQLTGIILRILSSLSIALMMLGISGSKKISGIAGIFFAPLIIGLESYVWISAHTSGIFIVFFGVGVFFWTYSLRNRKILYSVVAVLTLLISFSVSPARGIAMVVLLPLWDVLMLMVTPSKKLFKYIVVRNVIILTLTFFLLHLLNSNGTFTVPSLGQKMINGLFLDTSFLKTLLSSLGNSIIGWLVPIPESGSLTNVSTLSILGGIFLVFFTAVSGVLFLIKRKTPFAIFFFFSFWMILFYLPNWLFDQTLTVAPSHRYVTISSVGLVAILSYVIGNIKKKWWIVLAFLFVVLNVLATRRVITEQTTYRSARIVNYLWNKINFDVPKGEKGDIFMYEGGDNIRGSDLDWSFSIPFVLQRKLTQQEDTPIATGDRMLIKKLLCEYNVPRPAIGTWIIQKKRIPLSHLYAWNVTNGVITNVSQKERMSFASNADPTKPDCSGM